MNTMPYTSYDRISLGILIEENPHHVPNNTKRTHMFGNFPPHLIVGSLKKSFEP